MRWVALALILLSLPVFVALIGNNKGRRDLALMALGALPFATGPMQVDAALISWASWPGMSKGILLSPIDTLALALILTRRRGVDGLPFRILIALYSLPILVSVAVSSLPTASTFVLVQLVQMMLLFIAVAGELARPTALRSLLAGISVGLILQSGFVIGQKMRGVVQASGAMSHQNILGMVAELSVLPLIAAVLEGDRRKIIYAGIVAGLIIVAGGGSRATMAFVVAGIAILTVLSLSRRMTPRKVTVLGLGVLVAAVVMPFGISTLETRFQGDTSAETLLGEDAQRTAFARAARAMAADNPLGVGANLYVTVANSRGYSAEAGVSWGGTNRSAMVHNAYLLARAETGWAGQLALIALLLLPAAAGIRFAFMHRKQAPAGIALGSAVGILAIAVHNIYEYAWHTQQPQALFFINLAIIAGLIRAHRIEQRTPRKRMPVSEDEPQFGRETLPEPSGLSGRAG